MTSNRVVLPGATIGVLGGGQLGRMLALAGRHMGYRFAVLDPAEDAPCAQVADMHIRAAFDDVEAARRLAACSDVVTYEFENVSAEVARALASEAYVPQGSELLRITQHRIREKRAVEAAGAPVAPYAEVRDLEGLLDAARRLGFPCVLKTCTGGYDGKGQRVVRSEDEAKRAFAELSGGGTNELVLERWVAFEREISVIVARSPRGEIRAFPPAENVHVDNILHLSIAPARIGEAVRRHAEELAVRVAESLGVVGLLAVEMFVTADGRLYVNELAPRPHNSGHYTMEACATSQFEQHVRAICDLPLGPTRLWTPVVMVNILGQHVASVLEWWPEAERDLPRGATAKLHLYGKRDALPNRKMGHVNLLCDDPEAVLEWAIRSPIWRDRTESLRRAGRLPEVREARLSPADRPAGGTEPQLATAARSDGEVRPSAASTAHASGETSPQRSSRESAAEPSHHQPAAKGGRSG